jgi:hypothetical protein
MPASFIVQDDLGVTEEANAYITTEYMRQYHLDRGRDLTVSPIYTDGELEVAIVIATDYIDTRWRKRFAGTPLEAPDQTTEWPRTDLTDDYGYDIEGIPTNLKKACAEYALRAAANGQLVSDGPTPIVGGEQQPMGEVLSTSVTVGPITDSKTFAEYGGGYGTGTSTTGGNLLPAIPAADMLIEPLLDASKNQRRAIRA